MATTSSILHAHPHSAKHETPVSYHFFSALKIPNTLFTPRWLSRDATHSKPDELTRLLPKGASSTLSLKQKYGACTEILHYGRDSTVRIYALQAPGSPTKQLHAVKIFRHSTHSWVVNRQLIEQALSTAFEHPNILRTLDTVYNSRHELCLVTDYCANGNLRALLTTSEGGRITRRDADCYLKQLLRGVSFLHARSIAHRDLRLENVLVTASGVVKITDFGSVMLNDNEPHDRHGGVYTDNESWDDETLSPDSLSRRQFSWRQIGVTPTPPPPKPRDALPYLAPEEFVDFAFEASCADVWAVGIIYLIMRGGRFHWRQASKEEDSRYVEYLDGRRAEGGYPPIEALGEPRCCNVIYAMLDPNPERRITASEALRSEWLYGVRTGVAEEMGL